MKVLFIGGTGNISWHCMNYAVRDGHDVCVLNRGSEGLMRRGTVDGVVKMCADMRDQCSVRNILENNHFDVVADFICYNKIHAQLDTELFQHRTNQFIFISTAAAYQKPNISLPMTEEIPLANPNWSYAQNKIDCEEVFGNAYKDIGFPVTIVRPSHTYDTIIPEAVGNSDWTVSQRLLDGKPVVLHGDGTTLWTLTHAEDFARAFTGLMGNTDAIGQSYHITSDEWLTWRQITENVAAALHAPPPRFVCVPSEYIAMKNQRLGAGLLGHKMWCDIYDNTKIKKIKGWQAEIPFNAGIKRTINWFNQDNRRKIVNKEFDDFLNKLCSEFYVPGK